jgi:arginyl-tRNA synthetase
VKVLSSLDIKYDKFDYESDYIESGQELIDKFEKTGKLFKDAEGRFVLDESGCNLEKEMREPMLVLTRSNGTGLYILRDLAYTLGKIKKSPDNVILLGEEQKLYFKQLATALNFINEPAPRVVHYSFVLIKTKEGNAKMSTRRGELVMLKDFFDEAVKKAGQEIKKRKSHGNAEDIAKAAIKYSMLRVDENKNIIFDWDEALNFEGESGPYLQYSYARANSILERLKKEKTDKISAKDKLALKNEEVALIKQIDFFKTAVHEASKQLAPHIIANYSFELAKKFNEFYSACPVIKAKGLQKSFRIDIVKAAIQVLENSLNLLGIPAIKKM